MELSTALAVIGGAVLFGVLLGIALLSVVRRRGDEDILIKSPAKSKNLPVVDSEPHCENCRFFSLQGGQTLMRTHEAFARAAQHIPPWQMGRPRPVEPNPEYDALEAEMHAAGKAGDLERQRELHEKLLRMNPGELLPPETAIDKSLLDLSWEDFGACGVHEELRAKTDHCDKWMERS